MKKSIYTIVTKEEVLSKKCYLGITQKNFFDELDSTGAEAVKLDWKEMGYKSSVSCATSLHRYAKSRNWIVHRFGDNVYLIKKEKPNGNET